MIDVARLMSGNEKPLVTFALLGFNQEQYVRAAVEAAFAQDYSRLEIILSDDCSADGTFEIMREMAEEYSGPHRIVLNRNAVNQTIGGHINVINRLARGELIVAAASDDISLPTRTSRIVDRWLSTGKHAGVVHSSCSTIDHSGRVLNELPCPCLPALGSPEDAASNNAYVIGATSAWSMDLYKLFGDLKNDVVHEDCALAFRSLLAGLPISYIDEPLVLYREFVGSSGFYKGAGGRLSASERLIFLGRARNDYQQKLQDLKKILNAGVERIVRKRLHYFEAALRFESGRPTLREIFSLTRRAGLSGIMRLMVKRLVNLRLDTQ
jgi:glycosyltransferase involved in cell wall biosynthesis